MLLLCPEYDILLLLLLYFVISHFKFFCTISHVNTHSAPCVHFESNRRIVDEISSELECAQSYGKCENIIIALSRECPCVKFYPQHFNEISIIEMTSAALCPCCQLDSGMSYCGSLWARIDANSSVVGALPAFILSAPPESTIGNRFIIVICKFARHPTQLLQRSKLIYPITKPDRHHSAVESVWHVHFYRVPLGKCQLLVSPPFFGVYSPFCLLLSFGVAKN